MDLRPLESSNVESAGYQDGTIRVLFRSGNWTDYPGHSPEVFADLLAAESPGRFVRERLIGRPASNTPAPLDTYDADDCCSSRLARALRSNALAGVNSWECPKCSVEWVASPTDVGRHWKPRVWVARL